MDEANDFHRWDSYLAELCFQMYLLRVSFGGGKVELKAEDFLMKFTAKKPEPAPGEKTPEERRAEAEKLKTGILGAFGINPDTGDRHPNLRVRGKPPPGAPPLTTRRPGP